MHPDQKTSLTTTFEALGTERVARGLAATGHTWSDCFLALALGDEPGALARKLESRWRKEYIVGTLLGIGAQTVSDVVAAWDHDEPTFRALAAEWLETNRTAVPPAPVTA